MRRFISIVCVLIVLSCSSCGKQSFKPTIESCIEPTRFYPMENEIMVSQEEPTIDINKKSIEDLQVTVDSRTKRIDVNYYIDDTSILKKTIDLRGKLISKDFVLENSPRPDILNLKILNSDFKIPENIETPFKLDIELITDSGERANVSFNIYDSNYYANADSLYKESNFDAFLSSITKAKNVEKTIPIGEVVFTFFKNKTAKAFAFNQAEKMFVPFIFIDFAPYELMGVHEIHIDGFGIYPEYEIGYSLIFKGDDGYRSDNLYAPHGGFELSSSYREVKSKPTKLSAKPMDVLYENKDVKVVTGGLATFVINKTNNQVDYFVENPRFVINKDTGFMGKICSTMDDGWHLLCQSMDGTKTYWKIKAKCNCEFRIFGLEITCTYQDCYSNNDDSSIATAFKLDGQTGKVLWSISGKPGETFSFDSYDNAKLLIRKDNDGVDLAKYDIVTGKEYK